MLPVCRILCVEDDEATCSLLVFMLTRAGFEVRSADTATAGLAMASAAPFNLYVLDTLLPDGSGVDLCRQLVALNPQTPVLFFTAAARPADRRAALDAGAQAYLIKPSDVQRLLATVKHLLVAKDCAAASQHDASQP